MRTKLLAVFCLLTPASILPGQSGIITTIAGMTPVGGEPVRGFSGDGGPAINAALALANLQNECDPNRFEQTVHLSVDAAGNVYIADSINQRIRRITQDGIITTIAGSGDRPANRNCESTGTVGDGNDARAAALYNPADALVMPNGRLVLADEQNNRIRQFTPGGQISTIGGSGLHNLYAPGIPATLSPMDWPSALALDANGVVYFAEMHGHRVGKIVDSKFVTVAGTGFPGYNGDGIQATSAQLRKPSGIAVDHDGNVFIADQGNHRIRKVAPNGVITTIAGNGQASASALNTPMDVKVDASGNVYVADTLNHRVLRIAGGATITVAGTGESGRGPEGVAAPESSLNSPAGLALDANNDLYIADWQNYLIRKVSFGATPVVSPRGIVNAASFRSDIAPGSLISIFGTNFTANSTVQVNGAALPLIAVTSQQINAQLPFEIAPGAANLTVANALGVSAPASFAVLAAAPGIFANAVLNRNNSLNSPSARTSARDVIVVFLTGQGAVGPAVDTGKPAPSDALSSAVQPASATIDGKPADVLFLGLAPGFIGLGQANILVPPAARTGDNLPLVITVGGQSSNAVPVSIG